MSHHFPTSPGVEGEQRKFINPTTGYVGANVFGPDGKPTAIPVEPGGEVWLTPAEERMTAEAPRYPDDNPFVKEWEEPVDWDPRTGEVVSSVTRKGTLVVADEPARPIASSRFIPATGVSSSGNSETGESEQPAEPQPETVTGADVPDGQPPVEGQPSENEIVGSPEAPEQNAEALAKRESTPEQRTSRREAIPT